MPYIWIWVAGGTTLGIVTKTVRLERYSQQVRNQSSTNLELTGLHFTSKVYLIDTGSFAKVAKVAKVALPIFILAVEDITEKRLHLHGCSRLFRWNE